MSIRRRFPAALIATLGLIAFAVTTSSLLNAGHTNVVLTAELNGQSEVSNRPGISGDPNGRGEIYVFGIDGDATTFCYVLLVEKVRLVPVPEMMAHIHEGGVGVNGKVVANLAGPQDGNAADCLSEGESGKFPTGETGIVQRILTNPGSFYVNVHNPEYPSGAIRGQLSEVQHQH
jgi:hypothetical protein